MALIGALVVGMAGFISLDAISETSFVTMKVASDAHETGNMIGHVTYELRGADGNIKNYVQSDNLIVDIGTDCAAQAIFDTAGIEGCTLGTSGGFAFIAIGNATDPATVSPGDIALDESGGVIGEGGGGEIARSLDIIDAVISKAASPDTDTTVTITSNDFTFTDLGPSGTVITQSGLFDSAADGNMFSKRNIPGTGGNIGLGVMNADTLSVTWTITLGNG